MAWYRRKTDDNEVLPELREYYEAERRERAGLSWLLALVSVACVALVIIGLFFSGKWLYGRLTKDKEGTTTVQTEQGSEPAESTTETTEATPAPPTPAPSFPEPTRTTPTTPVVASVPATPKLASTGPEGLLAVFVGTTLLAAYLRSFILKRKNQA